MDVCKRKVHEAIWKTEIIGKASDEERVNYYCGLWQFSSGFLAQVQ
jgi:hypothetical protein